MFNLREFVLKGITGMVGSEPDYKVIKYALGWYDREVLTNEDLASIDTLIENYCTPAVDGDEAESGGGSL